MLVQYRICGTHRFGLPPWRCPEELEGAPALPTAARDDDAVGGDPPFLPAVLRTARAAWPQAACLPLCLVPCSTTRAPEALG